MTAPLFLVVGPSGAGKDSLIDGAKAALGQDRRFHFARRVVTRQTGTGEDHDSLTEEEFVEAEQAGRFLLSWRAHGLAYGIRADLQQEREAGIAVIANVSRMVIDEARRRLPPAIIILVTAPPAILAERVKARGRESGEDVARRLTQPDPILPRDDGVIRIDNGGELQPAIDRLVDVLLRNITSV